MESIFTNRKMIIVAESEYLNCDEVSNESWMTALVRPAVSALMSAISPSLDILLAPDIHDDLSEEQRKETFYSFFQFTSEVFSKKINDILTAHLNKLNFIFGGKNYSFSLRSTSSESNYDELKKYNYNDHHVWISTSRQEEKGNNHPTKIMTIRFVIGDDIEKVLNDNNNLIMSSISIPNIDHYDIINSSYPYIDEVTADFISINNAMEKPIWSSVTLDENLGKESIIGSKIVLFAIQEFKRLSGAIVSDREQAIRNYVDLIHDKYNGIVKDALYEICNILHGVVVTANEEWDNRFEELIYLI